MNDYQIAKNLGEMFENATRSLNRVLDTRNIALPPSVTSFINTNYYNVETTFTSQEIIKGLESNNDNEVYTVLKHLVGKLATRYDGDTDMDSATTINGSVSNDGNNETVKEIVQLFPHIIKNVNSSNLKIKRLVYIMLLSFNHLQQDISLLSINAIQKSLTDKSAINRSLAIRCLSGIRIPAILPILLLSMAKLVKDSSPLVRSACTIAIIKCTELDIQYNMTNKKNKNVVKSIINENSAKKQREYLINSLKDETSTIYQLNNYLDILLSDNDPKVLSCAIVAYHEIFNGCFDILHNKLKNLIDHIEDMDSFAVSNLIDIIVEYSRLFFEPFSSIEKAPVELQDLYYHLLNIVYYTMDYNVTFSIVKCLYTLFPFMIRDDNIKLNKVMIKLIQNDSYDDISSDSRISISLNMILYLLDKDLISFKTYQYHNFIPLSKDNASIFDTKISILFKLINEDNFEIIFKELKFLVEKSDFNYFFKFKILKKINSLILHKNLKIEQFSQLIRFFMNKLQFEKNELLVGEYITGLRQLIQSNLGYYNEILLKLVGRLYDSYDENSDGLLYNAKSSIIWLLGEFIINYDDYEANENTEILKAVLPDLSLLLVKNFKNEVEFNIRFEILIFITKLMISDIVHNGKANYRIDETNRLFKVFNYVLQLSKYDTNLYIRDMSRLIGSLLPNVVYFGNISINQEVDIGDMLQDGSLLQHCQEKCSSIDLSVLMFQLSKPQIYETSDNDVDVLMDVVVKYVQTGAGQLDVGYLSYYRDLRGDGFELRDYGKYSSSLSSSTYHASRSGASSPVPESNSGGFRDRERSVSSVSVSPSVSSSSKYKLQTLDDFLSA